jgi:hypothetical protein
MSQLKKAVEERKKAIINQFFEHQYFHSKSKSMLYNLPLAELERIYIEMRSHLARQRAIKVL